MSTPPFTEPEITEALVANQLALQSIHLSATDLQQTTQHFKLIASHARLVMSLPIDEHIEPAPEFQPWKGR
ncbi:MAG TPA: AtzG-like protein [Methylophilus sp.]